MQRVASVTLLLAVLWLVLSGHFDALLLTLGLVSILITVVLAQRMGVIDPEGQPVRLLHRLVVYWMWLAWEIVKANIDVARRILTPRLPIAPTMIRVPTGKRTDLGRVLFANSITLTPGTVSLRVTDEEVEVHALTREAARELASGRMDEHAPEAAGVEEADAEASRAQRPETDAP